MNREGVDMELISKLLDGQADAAEARLAVDSFARGEAERDRWSVYSLIGDAVRGNPTPDDGFSRRILERLRREA